MKFILDYVPRAHLVYSVYTEHLPFIVYAHQTRDVEPMLF